MDDLVKSPDDKPVDSFGQETEPSIEWCIDNGYKIPKWLLKCNIKCPYVKGQIFQGKHGPINYSVAGDPSGSLVLTFHGYNATHTTFSIYQSVLSKNGYQVVAFDLYGHGLSGHPKYKVFGDTFSPKYYVDQADEVINHLGYAGRKMSVIGMSMGACLAVSYCEAHPDMVDKLVLISPAGLIPKKPMRVVFLKYIQCCIPCMPCCVSKCCFSRCVSTPRSTLQDETGMARCTTTGMDDCISVEAPAAQPELNPMVNRMLWTLFVTKKAISSLLGIVNRMPLWTSRELYTKVGAMGKLTLILFGDEDTLTPPECADELSRLFTNSHTIIFSKADHLLSFKKPLQVVSSCLAFLGIPFQERVEHYVRWLPFDSKGRYIPKSERELGDVEGEDFDEVDMESSSPFASFSFVEKVKSASKKPFKIFNGDLDVPGAKKLTNLTISGDYSRKKVPLVVVRQFEEEDN